MIPSVGAYNVQVPGGELSVENCVHQELAEGAQVNKICTQFCGIFLLRDEKRKPKPWSPNEFSHLAPKNFQIFRNFTCSYS